MSRQGNREGTDPAIHRGSRRVTPRLPLNASFELIQPYPATGTVINVSRGGLRVVLDRELHPNTFLLARVTVEGEPEVTVHARVVWARAWVDGHVMGLAYERMERRADPTELRRCPTVVMACSRPPDRRPMARTGTMVLRQEDVSRADRAELVEDTIDESADELDIDIEIDIDEDVPAAHTVVMHADELSRSTRMAVADEELARHRRIRESGTVAIPASERARRAAPPSTTVVLPLEELAERTEEPIPSQRTVVVPASELPGRKTG